MRSKTPTRRKPTEDRRGAVAVEFAFVAPVLVTLVLGVIEVNRMYDTQTLLETAAREGARFASMDRDGLVPEGTSTNDKMVSDMKTFLETNGMDSDDISIEVVHADDPSQPFDLDNPDNDLKLFEVRVSIDYADMSLTAMDAGADLALTGKVTFRNGVATLAN